MVLPVIRLLHHLPLRFPESVGSDDPNSSTLIDRSNFFFTTRGLKKVTWKTISPTDCILANEGKIIVSSPEFIKGQDYEVSLRNKVGWKETTLRVVIDEKNSFTIDSLFPGDYQLFRFKSVNDNCSISLKDTTIVLEAPNDLIDLRIRSNSPVCEGDSLLFLSTMFPEGTISWTGPEIFSSGDANPFIQNVSPGKKGTYEAEAILGYCKQKK